MIVAMTEEGYWLAQGEGPLRYILAEAETRRQAVVNWAQIYMNQQTKKDQDYGY